MTPTANQHKPDIAEPVHRTVPLAGALPAMVLEFQDQPTRAAVVARWEANNSPFARSLRCGTATEKALDALGVGLCLAQRYPEALEVLSAAVAEAPLDVALLNNLAVVLERAGHATEAFGCVERSLAMSHRQPDSWILLGNMRYHQNDLLGAKAAYETAIELQPVSPLAWQGLGLIKQQQRDFLSAIECLKNCLRQNHATAPVLAVLGQLFYTIGQFEKSRDSYTAALDSDAANPIYNQMLRELRFLCRVIEGESIDQLIAEVELDHGRSQIEDLLHKSFVLLSSYQYKTAAAVVAQKRLELFPNSATAEYMLHACRGNASVPRSPDAFLTESFNRAAEHFDHHLVNTLGYDIPEKLGYALAKLIPDNSQLEVLDAGCGTGLCGPLVRGFAANLTGVDLSDKMLERARRRGVYDQLVCREITSFLAEHPNRFDLIIAADVLIYFGDLRSLRDAFASSLRPGGLLAFSTERSDTADHQLLCSGRFSHKREYIRRMFAGDFKECLSAQTTLRLEAAHRVIGDLFVFRRQQQPAISGPCLPPLAVAERIV